MRRPEPLPRKFAARPFAVQAALAEGVGRGRLDSSDLTRPFHGVRAPRGHDLIAAYAPRLRPGDRYSHSTAAALWGIPLPSRFGDELHVTSPRGVDAPRARGVIGHESSRGHGARRHGHPVSDPISTFLELATVMSFGELVAVGDYLVLDPRVLEPGHSRPYVRLADLRSTAFVAQGRGVREARRAAGAVREGVESPMETALRMLVVEAGLPEPVCGYDLRDGARRVGWFDLAWPDFKVIAEYDGDAHRTTTKQYDRDIQRFDDAAELDWRVIRVRSRGVHAHPATTVERITRALLRGGHSPSVRKRR